MTTSRNEEFDYLKAKHPEMTDEAINAFLDEKVHDHVHVKSYILVFLALGVLTVFTVAASYLDVPFPVAIFLGLLIASVKASLVALVFMHLNDERKVIYGFLGLTVLFFTIMIFLTLTGEADTLGQPSLAVQAANEEAIAKIKESSYHGEAHDGEAHDGEAHDGDVFQVTATQNNGSGIIRGKVLWDGPIPKIKDVDMGSTPGCLDIHGGNPKSETLVLGNDNSIANILVRIRRGLPTTASYTAPSDVAEVDQYGCVYKPHVLAIQKGQTISYKNSDVVPHNVHTLSEANPAFNKAVNVGGNPIDRTYDAEELFFVKCDIHPWMKCWVHVIDHPFFTVTQEDGQFEIAGLPDGQFELEFWHEKMGTRHQIVSVDSGQLTELEYRFTKDN
ncbi:MAG: cytochrome C oxidase subunit IV family protein [Candidatus Poribacteria bacterium]|nr:cytochrome C oxidase subunit IV family protein [Candidatus Poribacteria bacterium]